MFRFVWFKTVTVKYRCHNMGLPSLNVVFVSLQDLLARCRTQLWRLDLCRPSTARCQGLNTFAIHLFSKPLNPQTKPLPCETGERPELAARTKTYSCVFGASLSFINRSKSSRSLALRSLPRNSSKAARSSSSLRRMASSSSSLVLRYSSKA